MAQPWFEPCVSADDNVYLKLENDEHRNEYYSYIVLYMGDVVCIHKEPDKYLNFFDRYFCPKDPPEWLTIYLGADKSKLTITINGNVVTCWAMRTDSHVKKALQVVESKLKEDNVRRNH